MYQQKYIEIKNIYSKLKGGMDEESKVDVKSVHCDEKIQIHSGEVSKLLTKATRKCIQHYTILIDGLSSKLDIENLKKHKIKNIKVVNTTKINDILAHIKEFTSLESLDLSDCKELNDHGLTHIKELPSLTSLDLTGCERLTNCGLRHLIDIRSLTSLNLSWCRQLNTCGLEHIKELQYLESLDLSKCDKITDNGLEHLKELRYLKSLDLSECDGITDAGLEHLRKMTSLNSLDLTLCLKITEEAIRNLQDYFTDDYLGIPSIVITTDYEGIIPIPGLPPSKPLW